MLLSREISTVGKLLRPGSNHEQVEVLLDNGTMLQQEQYWMTESVLVAIHNYALSVGQAFTTVRTCNLDGRADIRQREQFPMIIFLHDKEFAGESWFEDVNSIESTRVIRTSHFVNGGLRMFHYVLMNSRRPGEGISI